MSINVNDKNLGHATAYAYYKAGGGTMTEAEFTEFMADFGTASQTAVEAAQAALASKNAAQTAATTATNKATEATTAAQTATSKAAEASTSASTATSAKDTAVSASQTATTKATEATTAAATATSAATTATTAKDDAVSAKTAAQTAQTGAETAAASVAESAAQIQTNAEDISQLKSEFTALESEGVVPSAEQILTDKGVTDSVPYHYRKTGGDGADRLYDQIVGGTVNWNQLAMFVAKQIPSNANGITYAYTDGKSFKVTGTASAVEERTGWFYLSETQALPTSRLGHKVLVTTRVVSGSFTGSINYAIGGTSNYSWGSSIVGELAYYNSQIRFKTQIMKGTVCTDLVLSFNVFDLTAMFGPTIADYIYNLEQTTAGAGVAWFRKLFPNDYYEYDTGTLKSVDGVSAHKMVGFNQWDEEWEAGGINISNGLAVSSNVAIRSKNYNKILGNTTYYINTPYGSNVILFYDEQKKYISYLNIRNKQLTTPEDAFFFKVRVGADAAPQITYNHDICINLSDPAKNGTYEPYKAHSYPLDSTLTLRGLFKLDANNKLYADGDVYEYTGKVTRNTILRAYQSGDESLANAITDGTNTVVYSANASTEQADPYQHLQQCDPNGTEEYVSTGIVPIGHNSFYPENLRAKVEGLPWNFATLIAPTEATYTATRNYTTGSLFIVDNVLYKATSNIANGGTITPNTNCTATTLAEIISALA